MLPPLLALLYDFAQIRNRPYLIRSQLHAWMLRDKLNGMIEVSRLKDEQAGELFLGFRIGLFQFFEPPDNTVPHRTRHRGVRRTSKTFGQSLPVTNSLWPAAS